MKPYRIVLADDHMLFRQGMKKLIESMPGMEVIGETGDGLELLNVLRELRPDMAVIDISMPNLRGLEAAREIQILYPEMSVLILTMHRNKEYLYHAISAGAKGYLLKEDSDIELFEAIKTIRKGEIYVTRLLAGALAEDLSRLYRGDGEIPQEPLTTREREVLKLIAEGKGNGEVGDLLCISTRTVENHRANIMRKLNLRNTADLVRYAVQKDMV